MLYSEILFYVTYHLSLVINIAWWMPASILVLFRVTIFDCSVIEYDKLMIYRFLGMLKCRPSMALVDKSNFEYIGRDMSVNPFYNFNTHNALRVEIDLECNGIKF